METDHRKYLPPGYREDTNHDYPPVMEAEADTTKEEPISTSEHTSEQPRQAPAKFNEHWLTSLSHWFSALFSPLLSGTYAILLSMWLSYLVYSPFKVKSIVVATTFVATCVVPVICIFILSRTGHISDPSLNSRQGRTLPFIVTALCYAGTGIYYNFVNAPGWLMMFMFASALALLIMSIINRSWKISAHACGMGGITALLFYMICSGNSIDNIQGIFIAAMIVAGCVCTSRLILNRHTPWQVGAGYLLGFACTFLPAWFININ